MVLMENQTDPIYKGRIVKSERDHSQPENQDYIRVDLEIFSVNELGEEFVETTRSLSFPLSYKSADIKKDLQKYMETYNNDYAMSISSIESDRLNTRVQKTISKLEGMEI